MELGRLWLVRRHVQETCRALPAKVSSVPRSYLLQMNRQRLWRLDLLVDNDGPVGVIVGLCKAKR